MQKASPLPLIASEPWHESLKATAGRLKADVVEASDLIAEIRMANNAVLIRNHIVRLGALGEKISRDVQEALVRPEPGA